VLQLTCRKVAQFLLSGCMAVCVTAIAILRLIGYCIMLLLPVSVQIRRHIEKSYQLMSDEKSIFNRRRKY